MLHLQNYIVKEKISFLRLTDQFDIYDPATGVQIGIARENIHIGVKLLRLIVNKMLMPTRVDVEDMAGVRQFSIKKGFQLLTAKVQVVDGKGNAAGYFKSKLFSLGGGFHVFDNHDIKVAEVKGDWKGWNFKFIGNSAQEIGTVSRKWGGLAKELFTSADSYVITINDSVSSQGKSMLLVAAGLAIDIVFKEKK
jgi:uncharacterized protein YxjI